MLDTTNWRNPAEHSFRPKHPIGAPDGSLPQIRMAI